MTGTRKDRRRSLWGLLTAVFVFLAAVSSASGDEPTPMLGTTDLVWQPVRPPEATRTPQPVPTPISSVSVAQQPPRPTKPPIPHPTSPVISETVEQGIAPSGDSLKGLASWYCKAGVSACHHAYPPGSMVAAACGKLRRAMGSDWRGKFVTVRGPSNSVRVQLVDWCGSTTKTIDLYWEPMRRLGGTGVLPVTVSW